MSRSREKLKNHVDPDKWLVPAYKVANFSSGLSEYKSSRKHTKNGKVLHDHVNPGMDYIAGEKFKKDAKKRSSRLSRRINKPVEEE